MGNSKIGVSAYDSPEFRRGRQMQRSDPYGDRTSLESLETRSRPHPLSEATVVLPGYNRYRDKNRIAAFLRQNGLRRINSGWRVAGYALTFRNVDHAAAFRLLYPEPTLGPTEIVQDEQRDVDDRLNRLNAWFV